MYECVKSKFTINRDIGKRLVYTRDAMLIEGNTWKDHYWGVDVYTGQGQNKLSQILMKVHDEIHDDYTE